MTPANSFRTVTRLASLAALSALLAGAGTAFAQTTVAPAPWPQASIEITPKVGYRWGGQIPARDTTAVAYTGDLQSNGSWGLAIDIPISRYLAIQLLGDHERTSVGQDTLFVPPAKHFDLDVNYYHLGLVWQWPSGNVTPFFVSSLGIGDLRPQAAGFTSSQRFSASVGAGVKVAFSEHVALLLEGRGFWTDTGSADSDWWDRGHNGFSQGQVNLGLTFSF